MSALYIRLCIYAALAAGLFIWGWHFGAGHVQSRLDALVTAQSAAVVRSQADMLKKETDYANQLRSAANQHDSDLLELARVRAAVKPGKLQCHAASGSAGLSQVPGTTGSGVASGGIVPPPVEFDPSAALTALADRADDTVELCRNWLRQWPRK